MMEDRGAVQELMALSVASLEARRAGDGGVPYAVVPPEWSVERLEHLLEHPTRPKGTTKLGDADSFCAWINERKLPTSRVYAVNNHSEGVQFVAVLDDTIEAGQPMWAEWRALYTPLVSPEWQIWSGMNGKRGGQKEFAEFIESNLDDVFSSGEHEPAGAVLLELSQVLHATTKAEFSSATRLSNGATQLRYSETITATGGSGSLEVPEMFFLSIPVFMGGPHYKVAARLRYRVQGTSLSIGFDLVRSHKVVEAAANDIIERITEKTAIVPYMGVPVSVRTSL
jgi:uncharacterized protein YfdQ (DUF2303 family)